MFTEKFSRTSTIHPGIFRGQALWADSVSPRMNTIASHDQFNTNKNRGNLVMNYQPENSIRRTQVDLCQTSIETQN